MKNNSSQSRFSKITAKVVVMLLAVVLSLSVLPTLSADIFPEAGAAEYGVAANTSPATINAELERLKGLGETEVDVILNGGIDLSALNYKAGIVIPAGLTVNFYMNNNRITYVRNGKDAGAEWQMSELCVFVNNGTLNIYAGGKANPAGDGAAIELTNIRQNQSISSNEQAYMYITAIKNNGVLTVNDNVDISVTALGSYEEINNKSYGATNITAVTAVYNTSKASSSVLRNVDITVNSEGRAIERKDDGDSLYGYAFSYGVYGGNVKLTGTTNITVSAISEVASGFNGNSTNADRTNGRGIAVAAGVVTDSNVEIHSNGTISYSPYFCNRRSGTDSGTAEIYGAGLLVQNGVTPVITDGSIIGASVNYYDRSDPSEDNNCALTIRDGTVLSASTIPYSPAYLIENCTTNINHTTPSPKNVEATPFRDEAGNSYTTNMTTANGAHPTSMSRGAMGAEHRVHVVYRYFTDTSRKTLDTSVVGKGGTLGYSYTPIGEAESVKIVKELVNFKGMNNDHLAVVSGTGLMYENGGNPWNTYYWHLWGISWENASSTAFSDYDIVKGGTQGVFEGFGGSAGTAHKTANVSNGPIYIFVDYIKEAPTSIKAELPTGKVATTVYTGSDVLPSDFGLKINDPVNDVDITNEYNLDRNNSALIKVDFSYTGTTAAGTEESGEGLPLNAGNYTVSLHIDSSKEYDTDSSKSKNRNELNYEFTLNIEKATAKRGSLPTSISAVYGQLLNEVLHVGTGEYKAELLTKNDTDTVTGKFSFENSADGEVVKNVGEGTAAIVWTPVSGAAASNYKETTFSVSYKIDKKELYISPNGASVVYGESEFTIPFSSQIDGLIEKDNNDASKKAIADALVYEVQTGGEYSPYQAGKFGAGSHIISPKISSYPAVLDNYKCVFVTGDSNPAGVLKVEKRALTLLAKAINRDYIPGNRNVDVEFSIISGRFGIDDIQTGIAVGQIDGADAAANKQVYNITEAAAEAALEGTAKGNYFVQTVTFGTEDNKLYVTINKAMPDAPVPTVAERNYIQSVKLKDITLGETTGTVAGTWYWVNDTINPTVKVSRYQARFVPDDKNNYEDKIVDVTINVKPTPVVVSYQTTVSYGDNIPNITSYTYTSDIDKKLNMSLVETSGNITPRTEYQKGSPVKAGGYPVTISAPNYVDVAGNYTFTIRDGVINVKPRVITFTVEDKTIVYGDTFNVNATDAVKLTFDESLLVGRDTINSLTASGTAPVFSFSSDYREADNYHAGEYFISANCMSQTSANYEIEVVDGKLFVAKAPLVIKANDITLEYGSDVPEDLDTALTVIGSKRNDRLSDVYEGKIIVETTYTADSDVTESGYPIIVNVSEATFRDYDVSVQNGKITVIKATPVIDTLPTASIVFGQTLSDAVFEGGYVTAKDGDIKVGGKFVYENPTFVPAYRDDAYITFTASFVPDDNKNYNTITGQVVALTVGKKPVAGILSVKGTPMVGKVLEVDVTGLDPAEIGVYTYTWTLEDGTVLGRGTSLTLTETDEIKYANTTVYVKAVAAAPYTGEKTAMVLVAPTLTDITAILNATDYVNYFTTDQNFVFGGTKAEVYTARPQDITFYRDANKGGQVAIGAVTVKYNGSTTAPTNVGTYAVTIDVATPTGVDYDNVNYDIDTGIATEGTTVVYSPVSNYPIGTLTISPAEYVVHVTIADKTYDGTVEAVIDADSIEEEGALTLANGSKDDVRFDNSEVTYYYFDGPDAGENKTVFPSFVKCLEGASADNYFVSLYIDNADTAVINKRPLEVEIAAVDREYDEGNTNVDLTFSFTPVAGDEGYIDIDAVKATGTISSDAANSNPYFVNIKDEDIVLIDKNPKEREVAKNYTLVIKNKNSVTVTISPTTPYYPIPEVHEILYYNSARPLGDIGLGHSHWSWKTPNVVPVAGSHTYTAVYDPMDTNYKTVEYEVTLDIRKTVVTITAADFTVTYGDIDPTYYYDVKGLTGSDTIANAVEGYVLMDCTYEAGSPVGEYTIKLDGAFESDNYDFRYVNGKVKVNPRTAYVDVLPESREYEPGNVKVKVRFSAIENLFSGDTNKDVYLQYTDYIEGTITDANAGIKTVTYTMPQLAGTKAGNYVIVPKKTSPTVEILKAVIPNVILPATGKVYYGNKLSTVEYTSNMEGIGDGTVTMENANSTPEKVGTFSDVYKVVFTPADTKNYATISQYITITVLPAYINVSIHFTGTTQVGKTLYVITNDIPAEAASNVVFEWYRVETPESDPRTGVKVASNTDSYQLTEKDEGKYIMCTVTHTAGSPYECNAICVTDSPIEEIQLTFWQKFVNWFYNIIANFTQIFGKLF